MGRSLKLMPSIAGYPMKAFDVSIVPGKTIMGS
jgi:hypothetical protein